MYIDLPGMGKTKGENRIINSDIMLDIIIDFTGKIIPNENFLLAGESYGGYLAREIIYKIPNKVDGLFLLCPSIIIDFNKRDTPSHIILKRHDKLLSQLEPSDAEGFAFSFNVDNMNEKFNKPTLIILGRQDSSVGYKDAWSILDKYPRATFAVLDRAGHNLQIEQEEVFNPLVNEWIIRSNEL